MGGGELENIKREAAKRLVEVSKLQGSQGKGGCTSVQEPKKLVETVKLPARRRLYETTRSSHTVVLMPPAETESRSLACCNAMIHTPTSSGFSLILLMLLPLLCVVYFLVVRRLRQLHKQRNLSEGLLGRWNVSNSKEDSDLS